MKTKYKEPKKTRNYSIRFDYDMLDFIQEQPNLSKFINKLIRDEMDRQFELEKIEIENKLNEMKL